MLNIARIKGNQAMKFGQSIEYNKKNIFLQKPCRKWDKETGFQTYFLFFKKALYMWEESGLQLDFTISW